MVFILRYKTIVKILLMVLCIGVILILIKVHASSIQVMENRGGAICIPILMYHEVKYEKLGKDVISPYEFESDLKYLSENGYTTITMQQLIDYVYYGKSLPANPIIVSFDDGYLNNYEYVLPLLKKYDMKIVFSVIGKNTDDFTRIQDSNLDYSHVTWDQLNEMLDSGYVELQNHSYNLHYTNKKRFGCKQMRGESFEDYQKALMDDVGTFQEKLTRMTGSTPTTFVYPYGGYNENTNIILKKMGFKATLSCDYGINLITHEPEDLFGLKRICRSHGDTLGKLLSEGMKTLKYIQKDKKEV